MRWSIIAKILAGVLMVVATGPIIGLAAADTTTGLSATQLFDLAENARMQGRPDDAEAIYRALAHDPDVEIRTEARFRLGQMMAQQGQYTDAALLYRAILDEKPEASRVRLELAAILARMGDLGGARRALRQAQASGLPPDVAQAVDQYATALRSFRPFGGSFELAMAPDSNINRATDAKTLDTVIAPLTLSDDARARSGIGIKGSGQLYLRLPLGTGLSLVPRMSSQAELYRASAFNDISGSALVGLEWQLKRDRLTPSLGHTWRWYGGDLYARTRSASLNWLHPAGKRAQIDSDFGISRVRYLGNRLQDGFLYNASLAYERAFTARLGGSITVSALRQSAHDPGYATVSGGFTALIWRDMGRFTMFGSATLRRLEADARLALFTERRREWYGRIGGGAIFRQIQVAGFSPVFRFGYERNSSTVGIYDYRRISTDIGISRAF